jgi:hypothetical protein
MIDNREFFVKVQRQLTALIEGLKPDQVEQLAMGKASLVFLPPGGRIVVSDGEVRARLAAARSRKEAMDYLAGMKVDDLKSLARQLNIAVYSKDKKLDLQRKIIDGTAGLREDAAAIQNS